MAELDRLMIRLLLLALISLSLPAFGADEGTWIGTWGTSPSGVPSKTDKIQSIPPLTVEGTIRYRLRVSLGGSQIRLRFSNEYSDSPLSLAAVTVGLAADGLDALPGSLRQLTFGKKESVTLPALARALSDPLHFKVKPLADLVVSVYVPEGMGAMSFPTPPFGPFAAVVTGSDTTRAEHISVSKRLPIRPVVSEVDVHADRPHKVIVTLGDSITDGDIDATTGERGWPDALARRLQPKGIAVVNAGIGGNRLLHSTPMFGAAAPDRYDRDVLSVPGLSYIVVLEGINDISMSGPHGTRSEAPAVAVKELIDTYSGLIKRAHDRGVKIFGGTIMPFEGAGYYSTEKERVRQAVNEWIRAANAFDAVIDFDRIVRDPAEIHKMGKAYDSGDHLHPSTEGYRKIGESIDLRLFD